MRDGQIFLLQILTLIYKVYEVLDPILSRNSQKSSWKEAMYDCQCLYKVELNVSDACKGTTKFMLSYKEWLKIKQLCAFLEPLNEVTELISNDENASFILAAPIYISLIERLHELSRYMKPRSLSQQHKKCLKNYELLCLSSPQSGLSVINSSQSLHQSQPTFCIRNTIKDGLFQKKKRKVNSLSKEINLYLDSECEDESTKPIQYCKSHSSQYPTSDNMSRNFLAVSAVSAPCKQVFLAIQYIPNHTHNQLTLENLESLICLKDWINHNIVDIDSIN
ncbi:hypothetical protein VP01_1902g2 [Puccinia sorghi]|uniref:HAT C-terminal dimerisation domain-containing protein n=1 Tax=Puccinia sorghi TaxID=27349 RepID=A0A0L6VCR3_9BASI|nr:hypothetical protein VP01_1902g2 [Puccinia sorghi]